MTQMCVCVWGGGGGGGRAFHWRTKRDKVWCPPVSQVHGNFAQTQGRLRARVGLFAGGRCAIGLCPVGAQSANPS